MKNFARRSSINFVALAALAITLAVSAPSQAAGMGGHNSGGFHGGGAVGQRGSEGGHFEGRGGGHFEGREGGHFEGREGHHFDGREEHRFEEHGRFGFGFGPIFPYYQPYYSAPGYWYYCPSYNGYYPNITSCPEAWVPYPAQ